MDPEDKKDLDRYIRDKARALAKDKFNDAGQLCNCIGEIYSKYGRFEEAILEHKQERRLSKLLGDTIGKAISCRKLGECYCSLGEYSKALKLQKKHLELARECNNYLEEQRAWATIGRTYLCQAESRNLKESSLACDRAYKAFTRALEVCEKIKASVSQIEYMSMKGRLYLNLGHVFDARGDANNAVPMMKRAISIAEKCKLDDDLYMCNSGLATMYENDEQYSNALRSIQLALKFADKLRDKVREKEMLAQKAKVHVCVGDILAAKHCLKKAYSLKVDSDITQESLIKTFKNVTKIQEAEQDLETETDEKKKAKLNEKIADSLVELGIYKEAIKKYDIVVTEYGHLLSSDEIAAIYMSLAQTYSDVRNYEKAIEFYRKELAVHKDDHEQCCRTLLNIAELEELKGAKYAEICQVYLSAFEAARKAKHPKLQVHTLKSLVMLQNLCKQNTHLQETEKKLAAIKEKYNITEDTDSLSDEEDDKKDDQEDDDDDEDLSIAELTMSDESDDQKGDTSPRRKKSKLARRNEKGETPLHRACITGNLKTVKSLIAEGHPVNPRDFCGWLPLHEACNNGHIEIVKFLLDSGASINDRGGDECRGFTPLIDAAYCGNLDVVRLLIDRGAKVDAKDDDGYTALDRLLEGYAEHEEGTLSAADMLEYKTTEKLLISKMGASYSTPRTAKPSKTQNLRLPDLTDEEDVVPESKRKDKVSGRVLRKRLEQMRQKRESKLSKHSRTLSQEDEEMADSSDGEKSEDTNFHPSISSPVTLSKSPENATKLYRSTMDSIGSSAQRRQDVGQPQGEDDVPPDKRPALLSVEDDVGDDWLIDDVKSARKCKKSAVVNSILTTSSSRISSTTGSKKRGRMTDGREGCSTFSDLSVKRFKQDDKSRKSNAVSVDSDVADFNENSNDTCPVSSTVGSLKTQTSVGTYMWDSDDDILCQIDLINDDFSDQNTSQEVNRSQQKSPVLRGKLSSLNTNNQVSKTAPRYKPQLFQGDPVNVQAPEDSSTKPYSVKTTETSTPQQPPINHYEKTSYKDIIRVKVKLGDHILLIPIQPVEQENNIIWLCQQARQRYFSMFLMLPSVTLSTQEGILLCSSDKINAIILDNDVLTANITAWERPRLEDRYDQACKLCLCEPNKTVLAALKQSDSSGHLSLNDLGLSFSFLQPVFQALDGQKTLTELCLNGNRLGDAGVETLMKLVSGLPVLQTLMLGGCGLSVAGVQTMACKLKAEQCLQSLVTLNLSHNCLGDVSEPLSAIIRCLPELRALNLSSCNLSARLFTSSFCEALHGCRMGNINLSENEIKMEGITALFNSLHPDCLQSLDLSHTRSSCEGDLSKLLEDFVTNEFSCLKELSLAGCQLSPSEVTFLNRLPAMCKSLCSLSLSQNTNVNNTSVQKLLYLSAGDGACLEELTLRGCSICSPIGSELTEALKTKMSCSTPLKKFVFSCKGLKAEDASVVTGIWKSFWKEKALVKSVGMSISLTVNSST
ncbi:tonsoku-like protein [Physella acuta]|uniref:tonsoku-like protein n=1 Tax=Physella acuta TaxID=109671 RepID=UPI0027DC5B61|nr:tonsoku-like protein [Physella acuta]